MISKKKNETKPGVAFNFLIRKNVLGIKFPTIGLKWIGRGLKLGLHPKKQDLHCTTRASTPPGTPCLVTCGTIALLHKN